DPHVCAAAGGVRHGQSQPAVAVPGGDPRQPARPDDHPAHAHRRLAGPGPARAGGRRRRSRPAQDLWDGPGAGGRRRGAPCDRDRPIRRRRHQAAGVGIRAADRGAGRPGGRDRVRDLAVVAIAAVLLLPPAAGAAPPAPTLPGLPHPKVMLGEPGRFGGTFLDAQVADPRTFNPILAQETSSTGAIGGLFDGLVEDNGETTETEPALAESWRTSPDGRTWTFKLRQGLQWSDGAPVTADDVAFTFQVIYDGKIPNSLQDVLTVAGKPIEVTKVDGLTIRFRTAEP